MKRNRGVVKDFKRDTIRTTVPDQSYPEFMYIEEITPYLESLNASKDKNSRITLKVGIIGKRIKPTHKAIWEIITTNRGFIFLIGFNVGIWLWKFIG